MMTETTVLEFILNFTEDGVLNGSVYGVESIVSELLIISLTDDLSTLFPG